MARPPHELDFVLDVPEHGTTSRHDDFDLYLPEAAGSLPAVVIVPGMLPAGYPIRPRNWPVYRGYGRLLARLGVAAVVAEVPFHDPAELPAPARALARIVESVRALDEVAGDRVAVWAFSGAAMLTDQWLAESPDWLRCLALSYPMWLAPPDLGRGRPLVVTRV